MKQRILIMDDDPGIREVVRFALRQSGFETVEAADGRDGLRRFGEETFDLCVLDIMMPELDGTDVCREIRKVSNVPIIFLSSRDEEMDRVIGLELGGDDYITKPFSPRELVARVKAHLRRIRMDQSPSEKTEGESNCVVHGELRLDLDLHKAFWAEQEVELTATEFGLLRTLLGFPGKVYERDEIMDGAYKYHNVVSDRTIDSHVRRIRTKFRTVGGDPIETVHGVGYRIRTGKS